MVARGVACDECKKRCEEFHHKPKELSPVAARFFKVIYGKDYAKVLYLPPEFAQEVHHLAGQETQIEDMSGLRWSVTMSEVGGSLAFKKGWQKFYLDHGLKQGELLVFNYLKGSHFVVQIYGRSACERMNFNNERPRHKRVRRDQGTASEDELFQTTDVNSGDKYAFTTSGASEVGLMQLFPVSMDMEDVDCMIKKDDGCYQGDDRTIFGDLSKFEMQNSPRYPNKSQNVLNTKLFPSCTETMEYDYDTELEEAFETNIPPSHNGIAEQTKTVGEDVPMGVVCTCQIKGHSGDSFTEKLEKSLYTKLGPSHSDIVEKTKERGDDAEIAVIQTNQVKGHSGDIVTDKFEKAVGTKTVHSHSETAEQAIRNGDNTQTDTIHSSQTASKFFRKPSENSNLSKGMLDYVSYVTNGGSKIAEGVHEAKSRCHESSVSSSVIKVPFGKNAIKKERVEMEDEANRFPQASSGKEPTMVCNYGQMFSPPVKVEPDQSYDIGPTVAISPFSAEVKSKLYLELPEEFQPIRGKREKGRGKVVYLRDSIGRIWPVFYPEKFGFKAFTVNWTKFCQENNINPGDECRFQVENVALCIFRADVIRRSGGSPHK